jgi:hypothetical protein
MNTEWHRKNKMPTKATEKERLAWHLEHRRECGCRPIPERLAAFAERNRKETEKVCDS